MVSAGAEAPDCVGRIMAVASFAGAKVRDSFKISVTSAAQGSPREYKCDKRMKGFFESPIPLC
jgi:hypothetical protein